MVKVRVQRWEEVSVVSYLQSLMSKMCLFFVKLWKRFS